MDKKTGKQKVDKETGELVFTKVPYQINGRHASSTNSGTWTTYDDVIGHVSKYSGVGFVLSEDDEFVIIDLDDCITSSGELSDMGREIVDSLNSFTEVSQSGNGLHIVVKADNIKGFNNQKEGVEMYSKERFFAMTGDIFSNLEEIEERKDIVMYLHDTYSPKNRDKEPKEFESQPEVYSDEYLLTKARNANNKDVFIALYDEGDTSGYESESEADMALANRLAFWSKNINQVERLMRNSALNRDKWDKHPDYLRERTIKKALSGVENSYSDGFFLNVEDSSKTLKKGDWWHINENGTKTFLHNKMALYILQEHHIARFPDEHGDLYIYNENNGIYEIDKTFRTLRAIIRKLDFLKRDKVKEVQDFILDMSQVVRKEDKKHIAVKNGLLQLPEMNFLDFTPDVFITKKLPTKYNPDAYDSFVADTLKKVTENHVPTFHNICEMFGAVLYPTLLVPKMFYLYGRSADNGKSTLLFMIQKTFNDGNNMSAVSPQKLAENTFAGSEIYGKMANIIDDLPDETIEDSGALKTIITGGYLNIEAKNKDGRTVLMDTVCITASNHFPNFKEHGNQINKRLYIIPFDHNFSEDNDKLSEPESMKELAKESAKEYVLLLAIKGIQSMTKKTGDVLTHNEKVANITEEFSELNDPLSDYFSEYDKEYFEEVKGTRAYEDYLSWCDMNNIRHTLGMKRFKTEVSGKYNMRWTDKMVKLNGDWKTVKGFKAK